MSTAVAGMPISPTVMTARADEGAHTGAVPRSVRRRHNRQQCSADRADERRGQQHERQHHAGKRSERSERLLCVQSGRHQPPRQDDRTCRRKQIGRECGQRKRYGDCRKLPRKRSIDPDSRAVRLPPFPTEQKAEQQHAEHLADCHSGEDQLRHCPAVAADCVQQHADGGNAHQLLSCFTDHGVLHAFQSDEQRLEDIFNPGQHKAEQHERKRLCRMRIAENAC